MFGVPSVLMNILNNILNNAVEQLLSIPPTSGRRISLSTKIEEKRVHIALCDNGEGVEEEIIDRIFDPFFTTKEMSNTTGNGLYFTRVMVEEEFKGTISVENEKEGACFSIIIPLASEE